MKMLLRYPNRKLKSKSFPEIAEVQNLGFLAETYGSLTTCMLKLFRTKPAFIQVMFLWTIEVTSLRSTITSVELLVPWFPTQMGYFKTLSMGK